MRHGAGPVRHLPRVRRDVRRRLRPTGGRPRHPAARGGVRHRRGAAERHRSRTARPLRPRRRTVPAAAVVGSHPRLRRGALRRRTRRRPRGRRPVARPRLRAGRRPSPADGGPAGRRDHGRPRCGRGDGRGAARGARRDHRRRGGQRTRVRGRLRRRGRRARRVRHRHRPRRHGQAPAGEPRLPLGPHGADARRVRPRRRHPGLPSAADPGRVERVRGPGRGRGSRLARLLGPARPGDGALPRRRADTRRGRRHPLRGTRARQRPVGARHGMPARRRDRGVHAPDPQGRHGRHRAGGRRGAAARTRSRRGLDRLLRRPVRHHGHAAGGAAHPRLPAQALLARRRPRRLGGRRGRRTDGGGAPPARRGDQRPRHRRRDAHRQTVGAGTALARRPPGPGPDDAARHGLRGTGAARR